MSKTLLIDCEGGAGSIASRIKSGSVDLVRVRHMNEVDAVFESLLTGVRKADVVVIDPVTYFQTFVRRDLTVSPEQITGQGLWSVRGAVVTDKRDWGVMADLVSRSLDMFRSLPEEGIVKHVILTAHEDDAKEQVDPTTGIVRKGPSVSPAMYKDLIARADAIIRMSVLRADLELDGKTYPAGHRVLRLGDQTNYEVGVRVDIGTNPPPNLIPCPRDFNLSRLAEALGGTLPKNILLYSVPKIGKTTLATSGFDKEKSNAPSK